jgi:hypothetical protein
MRRARGARALAGLRLTADASLRAGESTITKAATAGLPGGQVREPAGQ